MIYTLGTCMGLAVSEFRVGFMGFVKLPVSCHARKTSDTCYNKCICVTNKPSNDSVE